MHVTFDRRWLIVFAVLPVVYNGLLAIVNAHVMRQSFATAALIEISILGLVFTYVFSKGILRSQADALALVVLAAFGLIITYISTGVVYIDFLRNMLIASGFCMLGRCMTLAEILTTFKIVVSVIFFVLLIEVVDVRTYVAIFEPAMYFAATRGNEIAEYNDVGVFGNALGFEGRFGYGLFDGPRTSSIFLEQVSLGNMTIILSVFFAAFYRYLSYFWRFLYVSLTLLSLLSSESRLALLMVILLLFLRPLFSKVEKIWLVLLPLFFVVAGAGYAYVYPEYSGDNFAGRLSLGFNYFNELTFWDFFGAGVLKIDHLWDAGYAYIVCAGTIFGALGFWWFLFGQYRFETRVAKLYFSGLIVFVTLALSIGGTAIFSIKVASFYWMVCGYLSKEELA